MFCFTSGPNEALVKSGAFLSRPLIKPGGFVFSMPCCQQVDKLDLNVMTIQVRLAYNMSDSHSKCLFQGRRGYFSFCHSANQNIQATRSPCGTSIANIFSSLLVSSWESHKTKWQQSLKRPLKVIKEPSLEH